MIINFVGNMKKGGTSEVVYTVFKSLLFANKKCSLYIRQRSQKLNVDYDINLRYFLNNISFLKLINSKDNILITHLIHQDFIVLLLSLIGLRRCKWFTYRHLNDEYLENIFLRFVLKLCLRFTAGDISISNNVFSYYENYGCVSQRSLVNYNALYPSGDNVIIPNKKQIFKNWISKSSLNIIFTGRAEYSKGFDIFLEVVKLSKLKKFPYNFHFFGRGSLAKKINFNNYPNLKVYGFVKDLNKFYNQIENPVLILPSRREGFGLVIIEAWYKGFIVVASNKGSNPEILSNVGFVSNQNNANSYLDFFNLISKDKLIREKTILNSQKKLFAKFAKYNVKKLCDFIEND